ncbi:DNA repair RAD52-like protein 2, chloroplastic [Syzygium oleosum]|uniref:DNA repair RAD52-like protein 2, chloroplastic n=1 Tax=Syzygium oleosum TaxID=219896 RepID=UPI0024B8C174|nr:DNA repair RAD52-like protein 2, chloroplastic [Syzygium oleosum]
MTPLTPSSVYHPPHNHPHLRRVSPEPIAAAAAAAAPMALRISSSALLPRSSPSPPPGADGDSARPASVLELRPRGPAGPGRLRLRGSVRAGGNTNSTDCNGGGGGCGGGGGGKKKGSVPSSNYVVPLDKSVSASYSSCITRPLAEILRDLNKKIPDNIIKSLPNAPDSDPDHDPDQASNFIPWYHANRMLSFYAPGWCGEIRDVIFSDNGSVTVVYRVTVRGSDGEAHREATGTVSPADGHDADPVAAAEEMAFCKACARFGLGLYLYHEV